MAETGGGLFRRKPPVGHFSDGKMSVSRHGWLDFFLKTAIFKYTHLYVYVCMVKKTTKGRYNFTIDERMFSRFKEHCKKNCINMSAKIESYIRKETDGSK